MEVVGRAGFWLREGGGEAVLEGVLSDGGLAFGGFGAGGLLGV